ncbi:MAG: hypothetical protein JW822_09525 [Spirochaetales bacterium]|nr:hypothetical protein [Spirochaetales bacterium]
MKTECVRTNRILSGSIYITAGLCLILFASCSSLRGYNYSQQHTSRTQNLLVEGAHKLLGVNKLVVRGKKFTRDCVGTVSAIYYYAGIDLIKGYSKYSGGGVTSLYTYLKANNLIYRTKNPRIGDIIFWNNTVDKDGDGKMDDGLTHVGMVVAVKEDGTIDYVHNDYKQGIVIAQMNLKKPDIMGEIIGGTWIMINTPVRIKVRGQEHPDMLLSGQLCSWLGQGYKLDE